MSGHVLHILDDLAKAWHTDQIADAAAQHYVYDEAPEWFTPQRWTEAACVLIEADTLDQVTSMSLPRRPGVVVIAHDLDDGQVCREPDLRLSLAGPGHRHLASSGTGRRVTT